MLTKVEVHNDWMFIDSVAESIEDCLDNDWASEGVDYTWVNPKVLRLLIPPKVSYAEVIEDISRLIVQHQDSMTFIPIRLIRPFSIQPLDILPLEW